MLLSTALALLLAPPSLSRRACCHASACCRRGGSERCSRPHPGGFLAAAAADVLKLLHCSGKGMQPRVCAGKMSGRAATLLQ